MKIKDLSFIAEVTEENTSNVNGGATNPFANVGNYPYLEQLSNLNELIFSGASQNDINSFLFEQSIENSLGVYDINPTIEPTVFPGPGS
jgi:hypothetical protein